MIVRKGDTVQVIAGREKGKKGTVEQVSAQTGRVIVGGVNIRKRHIKPTRTAPKGGIVEMPAALARANVMVVCPHCGKATRGRMTMAENAKFRSCTFCNGSLDATK